MEKVQTIAAMVEEEEVQIRILAAAVRILAEVVHQTVQNYLAAEASIADSWLADSHFLATAAWADGSCFLAKAWIVGWPTADSHFLATTRIAGSCSLAKAWAVDSDPYYFRAGLHFLATAPLHVAGGFAAIVAVHQSLLQIHSFLAVGS